VLIGFSNDSFTPIRLLTVTNTVSKYQLMATHRYFHLLGGIHDVESFGTPESTLPLVLLSNWGHTFIVMLWLAGNLFHTGWNGNYELWVVSSKGVSSQSLPIAHAIMDPHFGSTIIDAYCGVTLSSSGIYNWLYTLGLTTSNQVFTLVILMELLALVIAILGHKHKTYLSKDLHPVSNSLHNLGSKASLALLGLLSLFWSAHLVCVSLPISRGLKLLGINHTKTLTCFLSGDWIAYLGAPDAGTQIFGSVIGSGTSILSFLGYLRSDTGSLYITDMVHHHLSLGILLIWVSQVLSSLKLSGYRQRNPLYSHFPILPKYSLHFTLSLILAVLGF